MPVLSERDLPVPARNLWLKALSAFETRNYGYTITLLQGVLKDHAAFLPGRQLLRRAELMLTSKAGKGFLKGLSTAQLSVMKAQQLLKKDPKAALVAVEEVLEKEPTNQAANFLLRDAALACGLPETAGFALETLRDAHPKEPKILHELARFYSSQDQPERAVEIYNQLIEINPADLEAIKAGKDASARASMRSGGWEAAKDYRDVLKNKDEAVSLEQQARFTKSEEMIEQQLAELSARYDAEPENLDVIRKIASLYEQREDSANALTWFEYASALTQHSDPGLIRKVGEHRLRVLEVQIRESEAWIAEHGPAAPPEELAAAEEALAELRRQRAESLIVEARDRVERNPTDLQFRFELGEQLVLAGRHGDAIAELQKARQSPSLGVRASALLAQCYEAKGLLDLAKKQYADAAARLTTMDALKKEIVYALALLHERSGEQEASLAALKQIYEEDYSFRDVAARVEGAYSQ
ncbi:MAG: hypothetical protein JSR82_22845 [Verrucomicrobia bacterium]|nr:hypothetical protein [Verrucomicrobiota bacterium]